MICQSAKRTRLTLIRRPSQRLGSRSWRNFSRPSRVILAKTGEAIPPYAKKAAFATKGYFAKQRNRRGRQEGYLTATHYEEIIAKQLFDGKTQLTKALRPLVEAGEQTLGLDQDEEKRQRTILRVDAGGGSVDDLNWVLARGYQLHGKDYSGKRAQHLAQSVVAWFDDPRSPGNVRLVG